MFSRFVATLKYCLPTGFVRHVFESTGEGSRAKILLTTSVPVSLLTYPKYSQPNKDKFIIALTIHFGNVAADVVLFRFEERNIRFF